MKRPLLLTLLLLCCTVAGVARTIYVVSVGICDYQYIRNLQKAENDATAVSALYLTHTPHVTTLLGADATHNRILSTLREVFYQAGADDTVVFFFSGHGSRGGLCAHDTKDGRTLLTYQEVQQVMRQCKAENKQLFIDACFSGGLRERKKAKKAATDRQPLTDTEGILLFLSSRTEETSQENQWSNNGFFTQYLIKGLKGAADANADRIITAKEIYTFVAAKVSERTAKKQNPVMWGKFNDQMHLMNWNPQR